MQSSARRSLAQSRRDGCYLCARCIWVLAAQSRHQLLVAAGPNGYDAEVAAVEGSLANFTERRSPITAASVRLKKRASAPDGFYRAIALRHTNRYAYERSKAVPADWREFLHRAGDDQGAASSCSTKAKIDAYSMRR